MAKSKRFTYFQPNLKDSKDQHGDCVIRALCKSECKDWLSIYDDLCSIGRTLQAMPSCKVTYETWLKKNKYIYQGISNKKGTKRPTVDSFCKDNPSGVYVLRVANHLVTCVDGKYYDIWDCGVKSLYGYWYKQTK